MKLVAPEQPVILDLVGDIGSYGVVVISEGTSSNGSHFLNKNLGYAANSNYLLWFARH